MPLTWTLKQWLQTNRGLHFTTDHPLTDLKEFQEIIKQRTGNKVSLLTLNKLLETQPKILDYRILQIICDAFQCELKHLCAITPSPPAAEKLRDVDIHHQLHPCGIAENESLRSFITRVRLAAISEAVMMTNNVSQAARLLGSNRMTLSTIRQRNKHATQTTPPSTDNAIPLPADILTIRGNEDFNAFTRRIQLAAILETIKLEGNNHTRAALRLGYTRSAFVTLRYRLETNLQTLNT